MREKNNVIIILKLITKRKCTHFLKLIFLVINISRVKCHIECFSRSSYGLIIIIVVNIKALSMPLGAIALVVPFAGVHEGFHAHGVQGIIFHKVHHVHF